MNALVEQRFIDYWNQRQQQQLKQVTILKQQAWQHLPKIVALLKQTFKAKRVIVYGSLLSDRFAADSDIDIAAEGIPKDQFFRALAAVNQLCDRWIDLKPLESLEPYFYERVLSTGKWIDETTQLPDIERTSR